MEKNRKLYDKTILTSISFMEFNINYKISQKKGGIICIECYDLINYGLIVVSSTGKYGKYGKGAGKLN